MKNWEQFAKNNMDELDFYRKKSELLEEDLEELKQQFFNKKNEPICQSNPFTLAFIISCIIYLISNFTNHLHWDFDKYSGGFLNNFFLWLIGPLPLYLIFCFLFVVVDLILDKINKISWDGKYARPNTPVWRSAFPLILYVLTALVLTILGPH